MKSLQTILTVNSVSSGATGLLLVALAGPIAQLFGVATTGIFVEAGIFLLAFAGFVFYESRRNPIRPDRIRLIVTLDCVWVIASLVIVLLPAIELSGIGRVIIVAVALWVALMAYLQATNLKNVTA